MWSVDPLTFLPPSLTPLRPPLPFCFVTPALPPLLLKERTPPPPPCLSLPPSFPPHQFLMVSFTRGDTADVAKRLQVLTAFTKSLPESTTAYNASSMALLERAMAHPTAVNLTFRGALQARWRCG